MSMLYDLPPLDFGLDDEGDMGYEEAPGQTPNEFDPLGLLEEDGEDGEDEDGDGVEDYTDLSKKPRRLTLNDVYNDVATHNYGVSYDTMTPTERNSFKRFAADYDRRAAALFGVPLRDTTTAQRAKLDSMVGKEIAEPTILPTDDPKYGKLSPGSLRALAEARYQSHRAQAEELWQAHRVQLREEAEETYQARRSQTLSESEATYQSRLKQRLALTAKERMERTLTGEPLSPLKPEPAATRTRGPNWSSVSAFMDPSDSQSLIDAWRGGSLGTTAVNDTRMRRYMALGGAATPYDFIVGLRNSWALSRPESRRSAPRRSAIGVAQPRQSPYQRLRGEAGETLGLAMPPPTTGLLP